MGHFQHYSLQVPKETDRGNILPSASRNFISHLRNNDEDEEEDEDEDMK